MMRHRRRAAGDRGAVAVEFALILPVLLLIVVGTIEFGRVYSQVQVYNGSAREGARCAAVMAQSFATCRSLSDVQQTINVASDPYADPPAAVITTGGVAGTGCTDLTISTILGFCVSDWLCCPRRSHTVPARSVIGTTG